MIDDADAPESIREKVAGTILSNREDLTSCLTPLLSLLDIAVDDPSWSRLDSSQQRQRIQDAMKRLLLQESRTQPLALIVEDLHWIDAGTQALLDGLIESLPAARLLLLVNYRPEYQHGWGTKTYYSQLRLDALAARTAGDLLRALLGDDPALTPLTRLLVERGNPLFIEESIQTFVETGALSGERGAYRLTRPIESIEIPATVQMILAARIERLAADDKQLLQTASVIGKDIPVVLLHAVAGAPDDDVQRVLGRLRAAEFLYEARLFPDAEYTFKHALTHEVTYGTLLEERRKDLHARVVGAIERLHPDRLTEHVEELAHHAVRGELWETAVAYLHQAGLKALARSVNREAVSYFEQALAALGHLPATRETLERAIDLRFDLKTALFPLGAFKRIIDSLREAEGLAGTLDDQRRLGQLSVHMCHMLRLAGDATEAIAFGERARTIAESLGEISLQVTANLYLGAACLWTGDVPRAKALLLNVLALLEHAPIHERFGLNGFPAVMARSQLTAICADRGEFTEGIAYGEEGMRLAESLDHPYSLVAMHQYLGGAQINRGGLHEAIRLFEHALALAREWHLTDMLAAGSGFLGYAYALVGRTGEGFPLLEQALRTMEATGHRANQSLLLLLLTEACVFANRPEDALEFAGRALTLARENGQGRSEAKALRLFADAAARRDPPEHAEGYYRDALALAEKLGMRPVVAHCRLGLGTMHARAGKRHEAQEHLVAATAMYREMDMPFWLERAEAARAELMNDPTTSGPRS